MTLFEDPQLITPYFRVLFALHKMPNPPKYALLVLQIPRRRGTVNTASADTRSATEINNLG